MLRHMQFGRDTCSFASFCHVRMQCDATGARHSVVHRGALHRSRVSTLWNPPPSPVTPMCVNCPVCVCPRDLKYMSACRGARALSSCTRQGLTKLNNLPNQQPQNRELSSPSPSPSAGELRDKSNANSGSRLAARLFSVAEETRRLAVTMTWN